MPQRQLASAERGGGAPRPERASGRLLHDLLTPMSDGATDRITLTIPADGRFRAVSTLVLGGIGTRLDLPYERMDDLQLAVLSLLDAVEGEEAIVDVDAGDGTVAITVGPLRPGASEDAGLERVVSRLVDELDPATRDGSEWMTVRLRRTAPTSA
jgi:hypothetical protein